MSDSDKISLQLYLDVQEFGVQLAKGFPGLPPAPQLPAFQRLFASVAPQQKQLQQQERQGTAQMQHVSLTAPAISTTPGVQSAAAVAIPMEVPTAQPAASGGGYGTGGGSSSSYPPAYTPQQQQQQQQQGLYESSAEPVATSASAAGASASAILLGEGAASAGVHGEPDRAYEASSGGEHEAGAARPGLATFGSAVIYNGNADASCTSRPAGRDVAADVEGELL